MSEEKSKRELLKDKVVDLVKEFIKTEGGLTQKNLRSLFGTAPNQEVITVIDSIEFIFL